MKENFSLWDLLEYLRTSARKNNWHFIPKALDRYVSTAFDQDGRNCNNFTQNQQTLAKQIAVNSTLLVGLSVELIDNMKGLAYGEEFMMLLLSEEIDEYLMTILIFCGQFKKDLEELKNKLDKLRLEETRKEQPWDVT